MKKITILLEDKLHQNAKQKCKEKFNISLSALIKVFLASFTSQKGVGFYIGDDDICQLFERWLREKAERKVNPNGFAVYRPRLKDLYDLGNRKSRCKFY
jgi:DNA-binding transcriptional regulator GbsR (MarR family)